MDAPNVDVPRDEPERSRDRAAESAPQTRGARTGARERKGWIFTSAIGCALKSVPAWVVVWFVWVGLSLVAGLPWFDGMDDMIGNRYEHDGLMNSLFRTFQADEGAVADASFLVDQSDELDALRGTTLRSGAVAGLVMMLFGVFTAGGWLQLALGEKKGRMVKRFFVGGARYYGRFLRLLILVLIGMSALAWLLHGRPWDELVLGRMFEVPEGDRGALETLSSENTVVQLAWIQAGLHAIGLFGILTWARYTRTRMALHDTSSVIWNGILTFFTMLRHPILTLRPMILLVGVEALALMLVFPWVHGLFDARLEGNADFGLVLGALGVTLAIYAFRVVMNGARTFAAVGASQAVVRPLMRPDPWKSSVGGPGGPRYPIGESEDEYHVSV